MGIEGIVHKTGNFTRKTVASGLLGLCALGAGAVPAYGQQNVKSAPNATIQYVHCTPQQQKAMEKAGNEGLGIRSEIWSILGIWGQFSNKQEGQILGSIASDLGRMQHEKEVAEAGRSQVNINQGQSQAPRYIPAPGCAWANPENPDDLSVRRSLGIAFAANYWQDFNRDGIADFNEFGGIKNRFYDDESITLVLYNPTKKAISKGEIKWELYYIPTGEKIEELSWKDGNYGAVFVRGSSERKVDWTKALLSDGGYGTYLSVFHSEGISEMTKFEILPASERPKNQ